MKIKFTSILLLGIILSLIGKVNLFGQCYQLVWSDEFNGSIGPDWVFETGGGGWGNNELEYYQAANATVPDTALVITAKQESVGGYNYTSSRMKTEGKKSWTYGKIEANIKVPSVSGLWPAFWMLGDNIGSVGWPACGEIDIMEQINTAPTEYGTIHWNNNGHVSYGGNVTVTPGVFHKYSITWTSTAITWYVDNVQFVQANIANGINNTGCFQNSFFIILNLAVGGNWPGNTIGTLPATYKIDYVRVYQTVDNATISGPDQVFMKEKDTKYSMVANEGTTYNWTVPQGASLVSIDDTNAVTVNWGCTGGNVQCHMTSGCGEYDFNLPVTIKPYSISGPYFVNANQSGVQLFAPDLDTTDYTWTVPASASLVSGQGNDTLVMNWGTAARDTVKLFIDNSCSTEELTRVLRFYGQYPYPYPDFAHMIPGTIPSVDFDYGGEGVAYHDATPGNTGSGPRQDESVDTEPSSFGADVGWVDANEWLEYTIKVPVSGTYDFSFLNASANTGTRGPLKVLVNGSVRISAVTIPNTGSWSNFASTTPVPISLSTTDTLLRLETGAGGFNIGTISILDLPSSIFGYTHDNLRVYPVPVVDNLYIYSPEKIASVTLTDLVGRVLHVAKASEINGNECELSLGSYPSGIYLLTLTDRNNKVFVKKIIKQ